MAKKKKKSKKAPSTKQKKDKQQKRQAKQERLYQELFDSMCRITPRIASLLEHQFPTRDDDHLLTFEFWYKQGINPRTQARTILKKLNAGLLAGTETIRRTRQKLQEENERLRGKLYEERHRAEAMMRRQMKFDF